MDDTLFLDNDGDARGRGVARARAIEPRVRDALLVEDVDADAPSAPRAIARMSTSVDAGHSCIRAPRACVANETRRKGPDDAVDSISSWRCSCECCNTQSTTTNESRRRMNRARLAVSSHSDARRQPLFFFGVPTVNSSAPQKLTGSLAPNASPEPTLINPPLRLALVGVAVAAAALVR